LLLKRVDFKGIRTLYGDPICCSNDGRVLVFRMGGNLLEYMHNQATKETDPILRQEGISFAMYKAMTFSLMELSPTGLQFKKAVYIYEGLEHFCKNH
jgi:hypothetical protein